MKSESHTFLRMCNCVLNNVIGYETNKRNKRSHTVTFCQLFRTKKKKNVSFEFSFFIVVKESIVLQDTPLSVLRPVGCSTNSCVTKKKGTFQKSNRTGE